MLFGQLNNRIQARTQQELYARGFRHRHAPQPLRKRRLRNRFRKRRLPLRTRPARPMIGGRRRLRKNFNTNRKRPIFQHTRKVPAYNQRIEDPFETYAPAPQTRDQVSVPLRDESYYNGPVLDPIKPMIYDPYSMMDSREEHLMDDYYNDEYDYDYGLPDYSPLKGSRPEENIVNTQGRSLTPAEQPLVPPPEQDNQIEVQPPTRIPIRMPTRMPTQRSPMRSETLLKMSEDKRLENLQKERAKLLEATIMKPDEMTTKKPEQERTRIRVPLRRRRKPEEVAEQNEIKMEPPPMFNNIRSPITAFQVI